MFSKSIEFIYFLNKEKDKAEVAKAQSSGKTVQYVEDRNITENQ
jgi:hypothetical protein